MIRLVLLLSVLLCSGCLSFNQSMSKKREVLHLENLKEIKALKQERHEEEILKDEYELIKELRKDIKESRKREGGESFNWGE